MTGPLSQDIPAILCACGCGSEVNPKLKFVRSLRSEGHTFSDIGRIIGCSGAYAKALSLKPPRFIKGHSAKVDYGFGICESCGDRFARRGHGQRHCIKATCNDARRDYNRERWEAYDREVDARRERREQLVGQRRDLRRLINGKKPFGSDAFRESRLVEVERELELLTDELKLLYEAQRLDDTAYPRAGSKWIFSLDAPWRGDDDALYEYRPDDDAIAVAFNSYYGRAVGDSWTDVVHAIVDRRREVDEWAEDLVA
jgi:hypothetical protein